MRRLNLKHRKTLQVPELKENAINITCQMSPLLFFETVGRNTDAYAESLRSKHTEKCPVHCSFPPQFSVTEDV